MARPPKKIVVTERASELKTAMRKAAPHLRSRLQMLLLLSQPAAAMSKQALATALAVNVNTIQNWRSKYERGGLAQLMKETRGGRQPAVIDAATDKAIAAKLSDPLHAPRSFKELQQWVSDHHIKDINYHTLNKHVKKKHGAKIKVARKSHVSKDAAAADTFKKSG